MEDEISFKKLVDKPREEREKEINEFVELLKAVWMKEPN